MVDQTLLQKHMIYMKSKYHDIGLRSKYYDFILFISIIQFRLILILLDNNSDIINKDFVRPYPQSIRYHNPYPNHHHDIVHRLHHRPLQPI